MNIDYSKIIARANERKDNLQHLAELLLSAPEMHARLIEAEQWALAVHKAFCAIDMEGRGLLPDRLKMALEYSSNTHQKILGARVDGKFGVFNMLPEDE